MGTIWFCLVAIMLAGYVVLDGFDIGAGILHLWIARTDAERRTVMRRSVRSGTATKSGCSPQAALFILLFRRFMPRASAASICR